MILRNKEYIMNGRIIITIILILLLQGCAGNKKNINKGTNNDNLEEETKRDRTPSSPRINIPTHTF
jgi:hypothetical protein